MKYLIEAKNISKSFNRQLVLNQLSFQLTAGEFVAIMGTSGSGKSTLLYALSGMDEVDSGAVFFAGQDLTQVPEKQLAEIRRTKMGFVFQSPTLLSNLNLLDNIIFPQLANKGRSDVEIKERAIKLMEQAGIADLQTHSVTAASGGQLQRASICRVLLNQPQMLFADEPTGALNSQWSAKIMTIFKETNQAGTTILLVTHDPEVAASAQRVVFLKDGQIVNELTTNITAKTVREILEKLEI